MTVKTPNLFSFATSELSQDAFLCWIAALSRSEDRQLAHVGKSFLAWLWESAGRGRVEPEQVMLVGNPERQVERIDVLLHAYVSEQPVTFLIEDKTATSHHSGQLVRYRKAAEKHLPEVVPIYFKTGYHFGEDLSAEEEGYRVIGLDSWVKFLDSVQVENDIFDDYRGYVSETLRERNETLDALWTATGFEKLGKDYAQFEFLRMLRDPCRDLSQSGNSKLSRGTNVGGTPWTHLGFEWLDKVLPGGIGEALFHRIDKRQDDNGDGCYYLSTRQYAKVKGNPEARKAKIIRLRQHREVFAEAVKETSPGLVFSKPAGDNQGANESEIGVLFFNDSTNTTSAVLDRFPLVHEAFVKRLRASPSLSTGS